MFFIFMQLYILPRSVVRIVRVLQIVCCWLLVVTPFDLAVTLTATGNATFKGFIILFKKTNNVNVGEFTDLEPNVRIACRTVSIAYYGAKNRIAMLVLQLNPCTNLGARVQSSIQLFT